LPSGTLLTVSAPGCNVRRHATPDDTCRHQPTCGKCLRMRQLLEGPEDPLPVQLRNEWPLATPGHIAEQLFSMHVNVHQPQRRRGHSLLCKWTNQLIFGNAGIVQQLCTRGHSRHSSAGVDTAIRSDSMGTAIRSGGVGTAIRSGGVGRWPGQRVSHHVVHTRQVANIHCKFCQVGQLPALHRRPAISHLAQGIGKWLMVRVDGEWPSLQHIPKMSDASTTRKNFSFKCRISNLC
jgi:hypothetical protein